MRRTYNEIREMIGAALLQTHIARGIVRKAGLPAAASASGAIGGPRSELAGQYCYLDYPSSPYGAVVPYVAAEFSLFPQGDFGLSEPNDAESWTLGRYADFRGFSWARLLVTVTNPSGSGITLKIAPRQKVGSNAFLISFEGGELAVPLDEVGLHITDWLRFGWLEDTDDERPAQMNWHIHNPTGSSGSVGVGLCQLQVREE